VGLFKDDIHPSFLRLGLQYANGSIVGTTARCVALLQACRELIADYSTPPQKVIFVFFLCLVCLLAVFFLLLSFLC
jgi:hypothetical protein